MVAALAAALPDNANGFWVTAAAAVAVAAAGVTIGKKTVVVEPLANGFMLRFEVTLPPPMPPLPQCIADV